MAKLSDVLARLRPAREHRVRRPADPTIAMSPREWADLPTFHPYDIER